MRCVPVSDSQYVLMIVKCLSFSGLWNSTVTQINCCANDWDKHAHAGKHHLVAESVWGRPKTTSWLTGYHPSQSALPKVSVCDGWGGTGGAAETASRAETHGSEVAPVPTVALGVCLCSPSPHQRACGVWPPCNPHFNESFVNTDVQTGRFHSRVPSSSRELQKSTRVQALFSAPGRLGWI